MHAGKKLPLVLLVGWLASGGCGAEGSNVDSSALGLVRGRVEVDGEGAAARVRVRVGDQETRTDGSGLFELEVPAGVEQRVHVDDAALAGGEAAVQVPEGAEVSLELAVSRMRSGTLENAEKGGRFEGENGFAIRLPEGSLRRADGERARGAAEIRYTVVRDASKMRVAPELRTRDDSGADRRLVSHGMVEVRFFQDDSPLRFEGEARAELELSPDSRLRDGNRVGMYHYDVDSRRWQRETEAEVVEGRLVARLDHFSWWAAAEPVDGTSCVRTALRKPGGEAAAGSVLTALGVDVPWLSTSITDEDGVTCVEVPAGASVSLSTFHGGGMAGAEWGTTLDVADGDASCGGDGCRDLGRQRLSSIASGQAGMMDAGGTDGSVLSDGGVTVDAGSGPADGAAEGSVAPDAGGLDAGSTLDGGPALDSGSGLDAGGLDAGVLDAGGLEGGPGLDAGALDAGSPDGGADSIVNQVLDITVPGNDGSVDFLLEGGTRFAYVVTPGGGAANVDIELRSPSSADITPAAGAFASTTPAFSDVVVAPEVGLYTLAVIPRSSGTGSYTVEVFGVPEDVQGVAFADGQPSVFNVSSRGQNVAVQIDPGLGARFGYSVSIGSGASTDIELRRPSDGADVAPSGGAFVSAGTAFSDLIVVAETGTYTLYLDPRGTGLGQLTVTFYTIPEDALVNVAVDDPPVAVDLSTPGENGVVQFAGTAGQRVGYTVRSPSTISADLVLLDPLDADITPAGADFVSAGTTFSDVLVLSQTSSDPGYRLLVDPRNVGTDTYTVEVFSIPADVQQSVTSGTPAVLTVTQAGQNILATFDATVGDAVSYSLSSDTGMSADLVLRAPSGTDITHGSGGFVGAGTLNAPAVTVPETSTGTPYSLEINPRGTGAGTFTLTVSIVSG